MIDFVRTDAALQRLVTEPGETWVLQTDQAPTLALEALATWSQTRGVTVLCFGPGETFRLLTTQPGETLLLHTEHPEQVNLPALGQWAQSRGVALALLPPGTTLAQVDDATLDRMHLMRKPGGLIIPPVPALARNGSPA